MRSRLPALAYGRRARDGFTLVEILVVLVVTAVIGAMAWTLAQVGTSAHRRELRRAHGDRTHANVLAAVGTALERAGGLGISAPNLGMVRAAVATGPSSAPADTLVVLRMTGLAAPVASRGCAAAAPALCVTLRGDRSRTIRRGELMAVGSARVGYRLLEVAAVGSAYAAPCGADCPPASYCPAIPAPSLLVTDVILGTTTSPPTTGPACAQPYFPDGSRCVETRVSRPVTPSRSACSVVPVSGLYTDVQTIDRTTTIGFPVPREWSAVSGGAAPSVAALPVAIQRIYAAPEGTELALFLQDGLTAAGTWETPRRVAGPVASFRVEMLHEGTTTWARGDGVVAAALPLAPNRSAATFPASGATGFTYARGFHTAVAVRIAAGIVETDGDGRRTVREVRLVRSLSNVARGGTRGGT